MHSFLIAPYSQNVNFITQSMVALDTFQTELQRLGVIQYTVVIQNITDWDCARTKFPRTLIEDQRPGPQQYTGRAGTPSALFLGVIYPLVSHPQDEANKKVLLPHIFHHQHYRWYFKFQIYRRKYFKFSVSEVIFPIHSTIACSQNKYNFTRYIASVRYKYLMDQNHSFKLKTVLILKNRGNTSWRRLSIHILLLTIMWAIIIILSEKSIFANNPFD